MPGNRSSDTISIGTSARMPRISRSLPAFVVAISSVRIGGTDDGYAPAQRTQRPQRSRIAKWFSLWSLGSLWSLCRSASRRPSLISLVEKFPDDLTLFRYQRLDALVRQAHLGVGLAAVEGQAFRRALQLDEAAVARLDDVHVDLGFRVFLVGQIEQRRAVDDADARGGDVVGDRDLLDHGQL